MEGVTRAAPRPFRTRVPRRWNTPGAPWSARRRASGERWRGGQAGASDGLAGHSASMASRMPGGGAYAARRIGAEACKELQVQRRCLDASCLCASHSHPGPRDGINSSCGTRRPRRRRGSTPMRRQLGSGSEQDQIKMARVQMIFFRFVLTSLDFHGTRQEQSAYRANCVSYSSPSRQFRSHISLEGT